MPENNSLKFKLPRVEHNDIGFAQQRRSYIQRDKHA